MGVADKRIVRVAVDGIDGAGKTIFADELASHIKRLSRPVIRASVDSFHQPKAARYKKGTDSAVGFYEDSFDYVKLRTLLLDPLGPEGNRQFRIAAPLA